jgi:hypothetical protein
MRRPFLLAAAPKEPARRGFAASHSTGARDAFDAANSFDFAAGFSIEVRNGRR